MKKKFSLRLAAGLMCAVMLAGCGGQSSSETVPQTIGEPTSASEETAETAARDGNAAKREKRTSRN